MSSPPDPEAMARALTAGDRRALARAITLVESARPDHRAAARDLIGRVAGRREALRIGLSGTPGVGKSSFIEAFGRHLTGLGLSVAVLAVDPSSARSGGSILGDKTRMPLLARDPRAFIRPSPAGGSLGGVARRTREAVMLAEAAGFDIVLVETVGVGQSETMVARMTDLFVLLIAPAGGDELQGVKRGIMEIADILLVNKADGELAAAAARTCGDYRAALGLMRRRPQDPDGFPLGMTVSALTGAGIPEAWDAMARLAAWRRANGHFARTRRAQAEAALSAEIEAGLAARFAAHPAVRSALPGLAAEVAAGRLAPETAAGRLIDLFAADPGLDAAGPDR